MSTKESKLATGVAVLATTGAIFLTATLYGSLFGSRGAKPVYSFIYLGKPAQIIETDVRYGFDRYHILLENGDILTKGPITTDTGHKINFNEFNMDYSID